MSAAHTPIPKHSGYFASPDGTIWSAIGWRGSGFREMKTDMDSHGYPSVRLKVGVGVRKRLKVHSLIATTFHGPKLSPDQEVRHLDGDRSNPAAANLAWGTRKENAADREAHGRTSRGELHSAAIKRGFAKATTAIEPNSVGTPEGVNQND
jgi:hypothetical protein